MKKNTRLRKPWPLATLLLLASAYFAGLDHVRPDWTAWLTPGMLAGLAAAILVVFALLRGWRDPGQYLVAAACVAVAGYFTGLVWMTQIGWFNGEANFGLPIGESLAKLAVTPVLWFMGGWMAWGYMPAHVPAARASYVPAQDSPAEPGASPAGPDPAPEQAA
jgi:hypothetical protein